MISSSIANLFRSLVSLQGYRHTHAVRKGELMKLAEALLWRGELQKRLLSLRSRIEHNAVVQEGETPSEDPLDLLEQAMRLTDEMATVVKSIHRANQRGCLADGRTMIDALVERDQLRSKHSLLQQAVEGTKREGYRYSSSEVKWVNVVNVAELQRRSDELAGQIRELNARLQEANWQIEME